MCWSSKERDSLVACVSVGMRVTLLTAHTLKEQDGEERTTDLPTHHTHIHRSGRGRIGLGVLGTSTWSSLVVVCMYGSQLGLRNTGPRALVRHTFGLPAYTVNMDDTHHHRRWGPRLSKKPNDV